MKKILALLIVVVGGLMAQTLDEPSYVIGSGVSYNYYGKTGFALQQTFAAKVSTHIYSYSTLSNTSTTSAVSTGASYCPLTTGFTTICFLGTAGVLGGSGGPTLGQFTGGGTIMYDIGQKLKSGHHYYIVGGLVIQNVTSQTVNPIYGIGFAAGF